jgi:hypothetical protein
MEGGVGAFTEQLARALAVQGHQVHVITSRRARPPQAERRLGQLFEPLDLGYGQLHARIGRWNWPAMGVVADIAIRHGLEVINIQYQAAAYQMNSIAIHLLPWRLRGVAPTVVTFMICVCPIFFPRRAGCAWPQCASWRSLPVA